jgi:glycosyltransferase involved in cell wall biosynthesis
MKQVLFIQMVVVKFIGYPLNKLNLFNFFWLMNMTKVSVIIPTYKRANLLPHVFSALKRQSYREFDVIVVIKPSGDGTEEILKQTTPFLNLKVIFQNKGHIVDAYFLGVKNSTGDIVTFLDDDAIPADNWIEETVKIFEKSNIAAITGDSLPVLLKNGKVKYIKENEIPSILSRYEFALFGRPLRGLEEHKNCITNTGLVYERGNNAYWRKRGAVKALLRGPSMAISGEVLRTLALSGDWLLGCAWEMVLGWHLFKRGLLMIYSPKVKVFHVVHGRTSSRDFLNPRADLLWAIEAEMLFYKLYGDEPELSVINKFAADIVRIVHSFRYLRLNSKYYVRKIEGILLGNIIGAKWLIYKNIGVQYSPINDLKKFRSK